MKAADGHHRQASQQVEFLKNVIAMSQTGDGPALALLREICLKAVEAAPDHDLITIANCLCRIGLEATRTEAGRN